MAILDTASGTAILALHAGRAAALLQETGFVHHQHAFFVAQFLHNVIDQVITQSVAIPLRTVQ